MGFSLRACAGSSSRRTAAAPRHTPLPRGVGSAARGARRAARRLIAHGNHVRGHQPFQLVAPARFADEIVRVPTDADEVFAGLTTVGASEFMDWHEALSHELPERDIAGRLPLRDAFTKFSAALRTEVSDCTDTTALRPACIHPRLDCAPECFFALDRKQHDKVHKLPRAHHSHRAARPLQGVRTTRRAKPPQDFVRGSQNGCTTHPHRVSLTGQCKWKGTGREEESTSSGRPFLLQEEEDPHRRSPGSEKRPGCRP